MAVIDSKSNECHKIKMLIEINVIFFFCRGHSYDTVFVTIFFI